MITIPSCRLIFYAYEGIHRKLTDPPAGQFLFEDEWVFIQTGKYKTVSLGGSDESDTYRHFVRQYLSQREEINTNSIVFETDPYWDDFYLHVQYKVDRTRSLPALESVKNYLYPDGRVPFSLQPDGAIVVSPPPTPEKQ